MTEKSINYDLIRQMLECAKREVSLRYKVYPKRVKNGYMTSAEAEREKALMYQIQICLQKILDGRFPKAIQQSLIDTQFYK